MKYLKYINELQFLTDFSDDLKKSLANYYIVENNKRIGAKELDIFIENPTTGNTFTIEVKGSPKDTSLPPEIIPWLQNLNNKIDKPNNHFIVISLSDVNENVKSLFNKSNLEVFEYAKHKDNLTNDFIAFIERLDKNEVK
jgi:hypothetical protein